MFSRLLAVLADLLLGGPVDKPAKPLPEVLFYPVIFANGRDDDTEGVKAFFENRPVIYAGKIIPPGEASLTGLSLRFSVAAFWVMGDGKLLAVVGFTVPGRPIATVDMSHGVHRLIADGQMMYGCEVQP